MTLRKRISALVALALVTGGLATVAMVDSPAEAAAPAPVILNPNAQNSAFAQWAEQQSMPQSGDASVQTFHATFLVQHAAGRTIPNVRFDANYDGTDNTGGNGTGGNVAPVISQTLVAGNGEGIETSRVSVAFDVGDPGGFSCPTFGSTTRVRDLPIRMKVVDSTNEVSGTVTTTVRFVEDSNCSVSTGSTQDYPRLTSQSQSPANGQVLPGQGLTYTFSCDDVDTDFFSSDDDCATADVRFRRLDDGTTGSLGSVAMGDNNVRNFTAAFATRGYYVVEVQLKNESGGLPQAQAPTNGWWRIGNAIVNDDATSLSGGIGITGGGVDTLSTPPSVNPGTAFTATASATDAGGGIQGIEWDTNLDGAFSAADGATGFDYILPTGGANADIARAGLSAAQLTRTYAGSFTATPGVKTVTARVTDTGSLDIAEATRRQANITGQLRVNALPTANSFSVGTNEDNGLGITLVGNDADSQPNALTYTQLTDVAPVAGSVSCTGSSCTYTPATNFNGSASFTYRVSDCGANPGACANSGTATVTINVTAVNDTPVVDPKSATTAEDDPVDTTMTGSDVEDGTNLTYTVQSQPTSGTASCTGPGVCTYTPDADFNGSDSYVVRGTDSGGLFATATVSVTVLPVNDAPVANDDTVVVPEDAVGFPINLTASDIDSLTLSFVGPVDDVDHGTVNCLDSACTYSPALNYNGPDSFTFTVTDGALSDTGTITIDVSAVNDAPVATDVLDAETDEDTPVDVPADGTDVDGDTLTATGASDPANGSASVTGQNQVTYQGDQDFNGIDTFDFTLDDGNGGSDDGTVVVTVHAVNDAPVVQDQAFSVNEDDPSIVSVAAGDVDGDLLTWSIVSGPADGSLFGTGPDVGYVPDLNFNGSDSFVVQVSDGALTDTAVITITVNPVNDQPVADATSVSTDEDTAVQVTITSSDVDGDLLTPSVVASPTNGTVSCAFPVCTYTPDADFFGTDLFLFSVDDGNGGVDTASVSITVNAVNDPPVAVGAAVVTAEDNPVAVPISATDVDGDALTFTYGPAGDGTVEGDGPNAVYVPNPNFHGNDTFAFTVDDGHGGTDSDIAAILVTSVNDAPVATGGSVSTPEDTAVGFQLGGTDVDGDTLAFAVVTPPPTGTLACDGAGACTYDPAANFNGPAPVEYSVSDGALSSEGVFTVLVDPDNDAPVAPDSAVSTAEDSAVAITLSASDTEDDPLTYAVASGPAHGTAVCSAEGSCTYTPAANYAGPDSFVWTASDGGATDNATVTITVVPVNDAPQASDVSAATDEDTPVSFFLLAGDAEGDAIAFTVDVPPSHGTVSIAGNVATYSPAANYVGTDLFTYKATDPSGAFTTARASLVVNEVPMIATALSGTAAVARVQLSILGTLNLSTAAVVFPNLEGTLTTDSGAPVVGRTIRFTIGTTALCSAVTNAQGQGTCASSVQTGLAALLNLGYTMTFDGDADYLPSTARGPIVKVQTLVL